MGKLTVADYLKRNPALKRIAEMLENAFNEVGERIRADLLKAYRSHAKDAFEHFVRTIETSHGEIPRNRFGQQQFSDWHTYADYKGAVHKHFSTWEDMREVLRNFRLTYKYAERDANEAYERARDSFVHKNMGKLSEVIGKRSDLKNAVLRFDFRGGIFEGNIQVYLEGAYFRGDVGIKYVIRRIPNVTPYFQYPLVFVEDDVAGAHYARPSEEELRVLLSGVSASKHAEQKASEAAAEGWCLASGTQVPEKIYRPVAGRMSPYVRCHVCGAGVSAQRGTYRKHKTPAAEKGAASAKLETAGYCRMSREKVSPAVIATIGPVDMYKDPKVACEACGQLVRIDAEKDWIFEGVPQGGHATKAIVKSGKYLKHKLAH